MIDFMIFISCIGNVAVNCLGGREQGCYL